MTSNLTKWGRGAVFCLLASLLINTKVFALDRKTSSALSHYIMAVMYDRLGNPDEAIKEYKKALGADYKNSVIHLNLAASYIKNNKFDKAVGELKLAASFDPEAVQPHAILALLYSLENKQDLATGEYEVALKNASKLEPRNIDIYKNLGLIYLKQKKLQAAEKVYRLILDLSSADAEAHFYLGNIYFELKNKALGEKELRQAVELKPDYAEALNYLGYTYVEENKNLDQAELMIKKALEIDSNNGAYIDSLGWLYFKQAKYKDAMEKLERAATLLEDPVIYQHLGEVYFKTGDTENAKLNWQKSLKLDPNQEQLKEKLEKLNKSLMTNDKAQNSK